MAKNTTHAPAAPTPQAAVVVASTAARAPKRPTSDVAYPVAVVWVTCFNACEAARMAGQPAPTRGTLFDLCYTAGVATNTIKTQVQRYLRATNGGTRRPLAHHLPRNVQLPGEDA